MKNRLVLSEDLKYVVFSDLYRRFDEAKTKRKAFTILEGAIRCYEKHGMEKASLSLIAKECKVTRPLLKHYFAGYDEIRTLALKYIRIILQTLVVEAITSDGTPSQRLEQYITAHFAWVQSHRTHARVWLHFLAMSSKNINDRQLNSAAVGAGTHRIVQFLLEARSRTAGTEEEFKRARLIQMIMLGALVSMMTEDMDTPESFCETTIRQCLEISQIQMS